MWEYEHAAETTASPEAVWRSWTDVDTWGEWNADLAHVELQGPFAEGSTIAMTPIGQETVHLRLAEVRENELFVDEAEIGGAKFRTPHRLEPLGEGRIRVTYRMEITGPASDELGPQLGPAITSDFPDTVASLIARAESRD
jgi:Polyketide cyclase / dehydrase and lipid transport